MRQTQPMARPLEEALDRIGDRWTLLVVDALLDGPQRFGELSDRLTGIAPNILTRRLRRLVGDGIVVATPYSRRPLRMSYELTGPGRDLAAALAVLGSWGSRHHGGDRAELDATDAGHHTTCGSALEPRLWCPTCDRLVDDADSSSDISL